MTRKLSNGGVSAPLLLTLFILCAFSQVTGYAMGTKEKKASLRQESKILLRTEGDFDISEVPWSENVIYFVGTSQPYDTAAFARDNSRENARNQVLKFYGELIENRAIARSSISGSTRDTLESFVNREDEILGYAQHIVSEVSTTRYYTEVWLNSNNKEEYIVYTLCQVPRQKAEEEIANFAKNISARYMGLLPGVTTLKAALEAYTFTARALEQNPLHRITAYYEGPAGRTGMYEYVRMRIIELANSVSFQAIPPQTVQKTETLNTVVRVNSAQIPAAGPLDCLVSLQGMDNKAPVVRYALNNDNEFQLPIFTNSLEPGRYTVQIELSLRELTGGIGNNTLAAFPFEVTPLIPLFVTREDMEAGIKRAVDALADGLKTPAEARIGPFTQTGTDIPSGLSRFLTEQITHHARSNRERKFRIVEGAVNPQAALTGFYTKRNDRVDITLVLTTPAGDGDGSQIFSLSTAELTRMEISIEPENQKIADKREEMFADLAGVDNSGKSQAARGIHIQAWFNESLTYLHRESLEITVMADQNCYFKIIHIDADNQMKMIYPNEVDTDNRLLANRPRAIFETAKCYLYEPYGAETILVAASSEQFANIEREYIAPLIPATADSVRTAVRGGRGGDLETPNSSKSFSGQGEARYTITVLKPHKEYEYGKPGNMTLTVQEIRNDALKQGGTFVGNETSGCSIVNNNRVSYHIPREEPDTIRFAYYNLDSFSGGGRAGVQTRGEGFSFYFEKPGNMTQTIQMVRSGIESKGGVFNGNEQQGSFSAKGISGQYRVTELVNVTITDKPVLIPNSLIEREVKNYFEGK